MALFSDPFFGAAGSAEDLFGRKPVIPSFPTGSEVLSDLLKANLSAFPDASKLASRTTEANQAILDAAYEKLIPGYKGITGQASKSISAQLRGELLPEDLARIERGSAAKALNLGFGGQSKDFLTARDLNMAKYQVTKEGLDSATRWLGFTRQARMAEPFAVQNMFLTPAQQVQLSEGAFQRDLLAANVAAAPDPGKRGVYDHMMSILGMMFSAYGGGAGYTGRYQGGQATMGGGGGGGGGAAAGGGAPTYNYYYGTGGGGAAGGVDYTPPSSVPTSGQTPALWG